MGTFTDTDSNGKVLNTGKYIVVWKKQKGKYLIIAEISNSDAKGK